MSWQVLLFLIIYCNVMLCHVICLRLYGIRHMVKDHLAREETCSCHMGYFFWLASRVLLYASSHRQDNTCHGLCRGALAGTRNSSVGPPLDFSVEELQDALRRAHYIFAAPYKIHYQLLKYLLKLIGGGVGGGLPSHIGIRGNEKADCFQVHFGFDSCQGWCTQTDFKNIN